MAWMIVFLILALIFVGLGWGLAIAALKILFYIFIGLFIISLIMYATRRSA